MPDLAQADRSCSGCGAAVTFPDGELSIRCSYCDVPVVDEPRARAVLHQVAPFAIERSVASARLKEYLRGKRWAPSGLRKLALHARSLRGVLIPFFVYQGEAHCRYRARIGIYWYRTETYRDSDGKTKTRQVRETEWFSTEGRAAYPVVDHLVSGSYALPESDANALEPFDLGWAQPVDARLLSGFDALVPGVERSLADSMATLELQQMAAARVDAELLPGDTNEVVNLQARVDVERCDVVALPVWIAEFAHKGETKRLLVNGQTGKCVGDVPISVGKIVAAVLAVVALAVAGYFIGQGVS